MDPLKTNGSRTAMSHFQIGTVVFDKSFFLLLVLVAMATKILHEIEIFKQLWKGIGHHEII